MNGDDPLLQPLLLQLVLIMANAFFSCVEIAVITFNDSKLERLSASGDKRAGRLYRLTRQPARFFATIQVGTTMAGLLASAFAADKLSGRMADWFKGFGVFKSVPASVLETLCIVLVTIILAYVMIVLGELVPKRIAMQNAEKLSLTFSGIIVGIARLFRPVVWLLTVTTNSVLRLMRIDPNAARDDITEEEIRMMVDVGSEKGTIDQEEKDIIHNVFELDNTAASEVMTHRTELALLWMDEDDEAWERTIIETRFTHYPICGEDQDDVCGVLSSRDYLRMKDRSRAKVMEAAVKPAQFVPESVRMDVLFRNMKKNRNHFAVVLDEYGGLSGVVTMNDLLEQLVGDLDDDQFAPPEQPDIAYLGEAEGVKSWRISGTAPLEDVAKALAVPLPTDEYDSFAGMVFGLLGTVPEDGQTPELNEFGLQILVTEIKEHRLECATVSVPMVGRVL